MNAVCSNCGRAFNRRDNLKRHLRFCANYECSCGIIIKDFEEIKLHRRNCKSVICACGKKFSRIDNLKRHLRYCANYNCSRGKHIKDSEDRKQHKTNCQIFSGKSFAKNCDLHKNTCSVNTISAKLDDELLNKITEDVDMGDPNLWEQSDDEMFLKTTMEVEEKYCTGKNYKKVTNVEKSTDATMQYPEALPITSTNTTTRNRSTYSDKRNKKQKVRNEINEDEIVITSLNGNVVDVILRNTNNFKHPQVFLTNMSQKIIKLLDKYRQQWKTFKANMTLESDYIKGEDKESDDMEANFKTKMKLITEDTDLEEFMVKSMEKIISEQDDFETKGSNWRLKNVVRLVLHLTYCPLLGGEGYIALRDHIRDKKACINVKNYDDRCFRYAILSKIVNSQNPRDYTNDHGYNFQGIQYPPTQKDIKLFEKNNNIGINIYALDEKKKVYPRRISDHAYHETIHLLYLEDDTTSHYCLIKSLSRLLRAQITDHKSAIEICDRCFTSYHIDYITKDGKNALQRLEEHKSYCIHHKPIRAEFPSKNYIQFKNYKHQQEIPVVIYVDFEAMLTPVAGCSNAANGSWSRRVQEHKPISVCMLIKSTISELDLQTHIYTGEDCVDKFLKKLKELVLLVDTLYGENKPMEPIANYKQLLQESTVCSICGKPFRDTDVKVLDHDHLTSKFRGVSHQECNLQFTLPKFIPVFAHNMTNYDSHFIVKNLGIDKGDVKVIPQSKEKYIAIDKQFEGCKCTVRFLDSYKFMSYGLAKLVNNIKNDKDHLASENIMVKFPILKSAFPNIEDDKLELLTRKGVFPYSYITDMRKLEETSLPERCHFYDELNQIDISEEDYKFANSVWKSFQIKNLKDYLELYLRTDVFLLCEVFEKFRKHCRQIYNLDPPWYYTLPSLAYDAMLKVTDIKLQILKDMDMIQFIEAGLRGGLTQNVTHYSKSNNKYLNDYNPQEPQKYIIYIDVNNLYGWAMNQDLPYSDFEWVEDVDSFDIYNIEGSSDRGYILEVDIDYPEDLHELHNEFPLLPEKKVPPGGKTSKLLTTVNNKRRYVLHYKNLLQAIDMKLKPIKIHKILKFKQKNFLGKYIELNNNLRAKAQNTFEKDFYKLMNNAVYGKTLENVRNRLNLELVTNTNRLEKLCQKPNFESRFIISDSVVGVVMQKTNIMFDKPIYLGFSILEISKTLMYDFHYNVIKHHYGNSSAQLLYTDTDSFIYEIQTNDIYEDITSMKEHFDTSNYPSSHACFSDENKQVLGKFKDETASIPIEEFVALRPKMYSFKINEKCVNRAKGIKKSAVDTLTFENYKNSLFKQTVMYSNFQLIQSKTHQISTYSINKKSLSPFDDKRVTLQNNINTLAYGHKDMRREEDDNI